MLINLNDEVVELIKNDYNDSVGSWDSLSEDDKKCIIEGMLSWVIGDIVNDCGLFNECE